ncbi:MULTISPECIES: TonB-dependent receptor [unclassified Marinobacter]|uniref:TonB-dependent receptor domain-containing protein n=1 Tax=unclassified Marinobacter TaxID=83889 RepID=UPI00200FF47A|nr:MULTISPECIES: TonB-dependent receptor [unclassified Marinobacter]MCL1477273.1 TonB-dependent receptor [Marinobacter sp.]MCL1480750.1 TonB-dependent receptor [Marinobacter sp.]MCL1485889.1 TonB-dependent receptor [Marinobacter sp.]MCL1486808.1 TonB-dependent receptor [Marinobacter sp.]UQG56393.1 TonB-dependent receptor [Marinobacter sp. M4C]
MRKKPLGRLVACTLSGLTLLPLQAHSQQADETEQLLIRVTEGQRAAVGLASMASEPIQRLTSNPAVSLSRMGGRGLEPIIRGQGRERVDVLLDGIRVEGACPNRMDPPTSRLSSALAPSLQVLTNNQTLRWGPVAGGQIVATTADPSFNGRTTTGQVTVGGADNGNGKLANAAAAVGSDDAWLRLSGGYDEANDYEDGSGNDVRSAHKNAEGRVEGGWRSANDVYVKAMTSRQEERDVKYAGSGMDAPKTDTDLYRLELSAPVAKGEWSLLAWQADVDHIMDNFSLRPVGMMKMQTNSTTQTRGLRFILDQSPTGRIDWAAGVDVETNDWDATLFNVTGAMPMAASLMWPGVGRERAGVFAEAFMRLGSAAKVGAGLRYDRVEMDATKADQVGGMGLTPATLYQSEYGVNSMPANDDSVSGFASAEWRLPQQQALTLTGSRSVRSPGVTERYIARSTASDSWIGNPQLETEKHYKLELALSGQSGNWRWKPVVWADQVEDFVLRYKQENGVEGCNKSGGCSRYENIDARLLGVEANLGWSDGTWSSNSALAAVRGENRDDNRPLPQIPPLQFIQTLGWQQHGHSIEAQWQLARRQDRIDLASGLDAGASPGYGVFNVSGSHPLTGYLTFNWALDNLFDNTWAPHVSRSNSDPFNPEAVRVNEPGRTVRAALTARW